jgi:type IV pilus assembly protein PilE
MNRPLHRKHGFSLIELMVAAVIMAITTAFAIPAFGQYLVRSNRAAAQAHLLDLAQGQQQYRADNRAYAATLDDLGIATPSAVASRYTVALLIDAGPPSIFTITATPITGGKQQADGVLAIDSAGTRTPVALW